MRSFGRGRNFFADESTAMSPLSSERTADGVKRVNRSQRPRRLRPGGRCGRVAERVASGNLSRDVIESRVDAFYASGVARDCGHPVRIAHRCGIFVWIGFRQRQEAHGRRRSQCNDRCGEYHDGRMPAAVSDRHSTRAYAPHGLWTARRAHASVQHPISGQKCRSARRGAQLLLYADHEIAILKLH